jgi:3'-5' exoribonuclease
MAKKLLQAYRPGEPVDDVFLLAKRDLKTAKSGSYYLALTLCDRSGSVESRMWDASPTLYDALEEGTFVHVKGKAETYNNQLQISIRVISLAEPAEFQLSDFLPQSEFPPQQMLAELKDILRQIEDKDYRRICDGFLEDKDFVAAFRAAPAAVRYHHAYLGGLLEHTLQVLRLALLVLPRYPILRKDLLLAAIFLHDVGKVQELRYDRPFVYTDAGQLLGHVVIGVLMVSDRARAAGDFPPEKLNLLCHCILSHHGEYEFGSPKLPMVPEALAVHYLDNLDAKLKDFTTSIEDDVQSKSNWTDYLHQFQRRLFKG